MFVKFPHIDNTWSDSLVEKCKSNGLMGVECICAVKIDGCNFQIGCDENGDFSIGSRNTELKKDEDFSGCQTVIRREELFKKVEEVKMLLDAKNVIVFGELCGGLYRHKDVQKDNTAVRIQGRVDYSPRNEWIVFDIAADGKFISQDKVADVCKKVGLHSQEVVFRGTLAECLEFSPVFIDKTGNNFWGFPVIEENVAEGVVIKPIEDVWIGSTRVVLKNKNPKFKERIKKIKAEATPFLNSLEQEWLNKALELVNESRVWSAVSKLGAKPEFGDIMREVLTDVREELEPEIASVENASDPKEFSWKKINKALSKEAAKTVRDVFLKL